MSTRSKFQVKLTGVHLCCQGCVNAVDAALRSVEGVNSHCDMENGTVTLTAGDAATARKALDSLAAAGFYGSTDNQDLAMRPVGEVLHGKVNSLRVSGIHNCCGPCCDAIKGAIATVDGVSGDTAKPRATTFEVTGDFHSAALVKALNDAGFSAQVKQ
jgi:periplasmic mercuric ion binding protein